MASTSYFNWEGVEVKDLRTDRPLNTSEWLSRDIKNRSLFGELDDELKERDLANGTIEFLTVVSDSLSFNKLKRQYDSGIFQNTFNKNEVPLVLGGFLTWSDYNFLKSGKRREKTLWINTQLFKFVETIGNTLILSLQNAAKNNPDYLQPHSKWVKDLYTIIRTIHYIVGYSYYSGTNTTPTLRDIFKPFVDEINRIFMSIKDGDVLIKYHDTKETSGYALSRGIIASGLPYMNDEYTQPDCKDPTKSYIFIGNSNGEFDDTLQDIPVSKYCGGASRKKTRRSKKISRSRHKRNKSNL